MLFAAWYGPGVVDVIALAYPEKGHTHGPLDATGGQAVVKCSHSEFNSANELTDIYAPWLQSDLELPSVECSACLHCHLLEREGKVSCFLLL